MNSKLHYWLTVFFKCVGGLGGGLLIGGILYLAVSFGERASEPQLLNKQGWHMLWAGLIMYGGAFIICHHLAKNENKTK